VSIATYFAVGRIELRVYVLREEQRAMPAHEEPPVSPGGSFLLLCRKTKMRHNSVAQATARCRINSFEDFDKVDYEGKRGKQAVSGKEKVLETPLNTIKCEHFCE